MLMFSYIFFFMNKAMRHIPLPWLKHASNCCSQDWIQSHLQMKVSFCEKLLSQEFESSANEDSTWILSHL